MKQLSTIDGQFLNFETSNAPQHIAVLAIYKSKRADGSTVRFKDILRVFEGRLDKSPLFRSKIVKVPFNLDQAYWVDDDEFNLEHHVRHIALPKPGDWRQLCIQVARLHSRALDPRKPLWEAYIIEGIDNVPDVPSDSFALYLKFHHCAVDGMGAERVFAVLNDIEPIVPDGNYGAEHEEWNPPSAPTPVEVLGKTWFKIMMEPTKVVNMGKEAITSILAKRKLLKEHEELEVEEAKPITRFDVSVSPHRVYGASRFKFADFKTIRNAVDGATINDVATAVVSIAMRNYLLDKGELPDRSMKVFMPISLRDTQAASQGGNDITVATIDAHTDIDGPLETLRAIHDTTIKMKTYGDALSTDMIVKMAREMPSALQVIAGRLATIQARFGQGVPANYTVTNVPGPPVPFYFAGGELVHLSGVGVLQEGHGLMNLITSYNGMMTISYTCCRQQMPDPEFYGECIDNAFAALLQEAKSAATAAAGIKAKKTAKKQPIKATTRKKTASKKTKAKKSVTKKSSGAGAVKPLSKKRTTKKRAKKGKTLKRSAKESS